MKHTQLCIGLLFLTFSCYAQESPVPLTYQSTLLGYGMNSVYDSYLSQLEYTGENVGLYYEQTKMTGLMGGRIAEQHLFTGNYAWSKNKPETASYYTGIFEYDYGMHYRFNPTEKLQVFTGAQVGGLLGFVYNTRNGNNPATGKFHLNLGLSVIATYKLKIKSQALLFRYQADAPLVGAMYAPQFGQSYYEIGLGDNEDLIHFASLHNYLSVRNRLSVDIPLNRVTFRLAYIHSFYETRINDLDTQINRNTFCIGISRNFFTVSGKQNHNHYRHVFE